MSREKATGRTRPILIFGLLAILAYVINTQIPTFWESFLAETEKRLQAREGDNTYVAVENSGREAIRSEDGEEDRIPPCEAVRVDSLMEEGQEALEKDDLQKAENALRAALECDPTLARAYDLLGWTLSKQGRTREAQKMFVRCVELDSFDVGIMVNAIKASIGVG